MRKFIIYGAGNKGKWCLEFLKWRNLQDNVLAFCDRQYENIGEIQGKKVLSYEEAKKQRLPFLITIMDKIIAEQVLNMIQEEGG